MYKFDYLNSGGGSRGAASVRGGVGKAPRARGGSTVGRGRAFRETPYQRPVRKIPRNEFFDTPVVRVCKLALR